MKTLAAILISFAAGYLVASHQQPQHTIPEPEAPPAPIVGQWRMPEHYVSPLESTPTPAVFGHSH